MQSINCLNRFTKALGVLTLTLFVSFATQAASLTLVDAFGNNPGNLKMYKYVPPGLKENAPLVVVLHGCGQSAEIYGHGAGWVGLADQFGFALVLPEQQESNNQSRCFNWFNGFSWNDYFPWNFQWIGSDIDRDKGEAESIVSMLTNAIKTHRLDQRRVFVTGLSGGGAMTAVMLATYPELFAGGAVLAGVPYKCATDLYVAISPSECGLDYPKKAGNARIKSLSPAIWGDKVRDANRGFRGPWPRLSIWHGTADGTVVVAGADELEKQWLNVHGLDKVPASIVQPPESKHRHSTYRDTQGRVQLEVHRIVGMGHGTPIIDGQCGRQGEHLFDVGICSSQHIARFWGIAPLP